MKDIILKVSNIDKNYGKIKTVDGVLFEPEFGK